jgi:mono/diheme cytochrome c family protein
MTGMRNQVLFVIFVVAVGVAAGQKPAGSGKQPPSTSAESGAETYREYCASCHGKDGKGDGPAAGALKVRLPDLTTLAKRKGGKFPAGDVYQVIKWGGGIMGHGSKEMPVWGKAFMPVRGRNEQEVDQRIKSLVRYIESMQVK